MADAGFDHRFIHDFLNFTGYQVKNRPYTR